MAADLKKKKKKKIGAYCRILPLSETVFKI